MNKGSQVDVSMEEMVESWVALTGTVLATGVPAANVKWALDKWGERAAELYDLSESGEPVSLTTEDLDGALDGLPDDMVQPFLGLTLICLFEGADGPKATADALKEGVDVLEQSIKEQEEA